MNIIIATPLYPPDIAPSAHYIKELASRLRGKHNISILTYGYLPEKIDGVDIKTVNKRQPLFLRLIKYTIMFFRMVRKADIVYAENGASVELSLGIVMLFIRKPFVLHIGDKKADECAEQSALSRFIKRFARTRVHKVITDIPKERPEILPFTDISNEEGAAYETSWKTHIAKLESTFKKYAK